MADEVPFWKKCSPTGEMFALPSQLPLQLPYWLDSSQYYAATIGRNPQWTLPREENSLETECYVMRTLDRPHLGQVRNF